MAITPKGVRMINENVLQPGRAVIITDPESVEWNHIPDGSLYVNPETGVMQVKRHGETSWTPMDGWGDDTLVISRDTSLRVEVFKVLTTDNGDGTFTYENKRGQRRTKPKTEKGFVFELDEGCYMPDNEIADETNTTDPNERCYMPGRNHLVVILDDVLERSQATGGVIELDERRFILTEDIPVGTEVTVKYIQWVRIGNPYPRVFESTPGASAQTGDFWLDHFNDEDELRDFELDTIDGEVEVRWSDIIEKPHTVTGFGISDASVIGHKHYTKDIEDLDDKIKQKIDAIGDVNAKKLQDLEPDKSGKGAANTIAVYDSSGKIPVTAIPVHQQFQVGMIMDWYGNSSAAPKGWAICDGRTQNGIKTPDLRGKFIIGGGTSGTYVGSTRSNNTEAPVKSGGVTTIKIQKANLPPHEHQHTHPHKHTRGTMNIKGKFETNDLSNDTTAPITSGAFGSFKSSCREAENGKNNPSYGINFDASRKGAWTGATSEDKTAKTKDTNTDFKNTAISIIPPYVALFKIMYVGV